MPERLVIAQPVAPHLLKRTRHTRQMRSATWSGGLSLGSRDHFRVATG
jgi:hypothetical protein